MKKLNQTDISDATGIHKTTISKYLRGEVRPSIVAAEKIVKSTGLPYEVFLCAEVQSIYLVKVYLQEKG